MVWNPSEFNRRISSWPPCHPFFSANIDDDYADSTTDRREEANLSVRYCACWWPIQSRQITRYWGIWWARLFSDSSLTPLLSSSGSVYLGKDIMTGADVVLKIAHRSSPSRLGHEYNMYSTIAGCRGICQVLWYSKEDVYEVIVFDHLGTSLGNLVDRPKFDHRKIFLYATQMVRLLYKTNDYTKHTLACSSHQSGHFMINTSSIVTSNPGISWFALIAFLPSFSSISAWHSYSAIPQLICTFLSWVMTNHPVISTLPFASINGQQGNVQSCRDDLESLVYIIIYSALSDLPWNSNVIGNNGKAILHKKTSITVKELCDGLPAPFCKFVTHVRSLDFDKKPDYEYLQSILSQCSGRVADQPVKLLPLPLSSHVSIGSLPGSPTSPTFTGRV